ncbi:2-phosphosulfolactate phosphatase [Marinilabiliaceae bacterium JC017]|nr:2-phosphosulfolactate phosphatase [Marinilabiliaceae bacterium JC017]
MIDIIPSARFVTASEVAGKTVVVIDVLRATSVMVTAFINGVESIIPVLTPEEAFAIKAQSSGPVILGGEREALPIPGFDYGNSPLSYTAENVKGKTLVMTTSNGTRAIKAAEPAKELFIGSFLNADALVQHLSTKEEICFVCAGTNGHYSLDDALCAGYIIDGLRCIQKDMELSDFALATATLYHDNKNNLNALTALGKHYCTLISKGYENDLNYCFSTGVTEILPHWQEGRIVK